MSWMIQDNQITNTEFIEMPQNPFIGDSPYTMWRITSGIDDGLPYSPLMIALPKPPSHTTSELYIGDNRVSKIYLGDAPVSKIYLGDQKIYES